MHLHSAIYQLPHRIGRYRAAALPYPSGVFASDSYDYFLGGGGGGEEEATPGSTGSGGGESSDNHTVVVVVVVVVCSLEVVVVAVMKVGTKPSLLSIRTCSARDNLARTYRFYTQRMMMDGGNGNEHVGHHCI